MAQEEIEEKKGGREGEIFDVTWRAWNLELLPADLALPVPLQRLEWFNWTGSGQLKR